MKKYYVYELYNLMGTVEYVGESTNPKRRLYEHKNQKTRGSGKFIGRTDIHMHIVKEFDIRKEAWDYQCKLQSEYGFDTDGEKISNSLKGHIVSEETKNKLRYEKSEEHKLKISKSVSKILKGNQYAKGKMHSDETKQKMKDAWVIRKQNSAFLKS